MYCRFFLFFFFFLFTTSCFADTAASAWDCKQSEDGEWICITESKSKPQAIAQPPAGTYEPESEQVERPDLDVIPEPVERPDLDVTPEPVEAADLDVIP